MKLKLPACRRMLAGILIPILLPWAALPVRANDLQRTPVPLENNNVDAIASSVWSMDAIDESGSDQSTRTYTFHNDQNVIATVTVIPFDHFFSESDVLPELELVPQ